MLPNVITVLRAVQSSTHLHIHTGRRALGRTCGMLANCRKAPWSEAAVLESHALEAWSKACQVCSSSHRHRAQGAAAAQISTGQAGPIRCGGKGEGARGGGCLRRCRCWLLRQPRADNLHQQMFMAHVCGVRLA